MASALSGARAKPARETVPIRARRKHLVGDAVAQKNDGRAGARFDPKLSLGQREAEETPVFFLPAGVEKENDRDGAATLVAESIEMFAVKRARRIPGIMTFPVPKPEIQGFVQYSPKTIENFCDLELRGCGKRGISRLKPRRSISANFRIGPAIPRSADSSCAKRSPRPQGFDLRADAQAKSFGEKIGLDAIALSRQLVGDAAENFIRHDGDPSMCFVTPARSSSRIPIATRSAVSSKKYVTSKCRFRRTGGKNTFRWLHQNQTMAE